MNVKLEIPEPAEGRSIDLDIFEVLSDICSVLIEILFIDAKSD
jgi:hypothetical protein